MIVHLVKELSHCREVAFSRGLGCFSVGLQLVFKICILYLTISNYLDLTRGTAGRRALVKVRISNHKLLLEIGRYNRTTRDNRHCPLCGSNLIEKDVHFLFRCSAYRMIRNNFYNKIKTLIPNITQLPVNNLINELMNFSHYFINIQFMKYISPCFDLRYKLLPKYLTYDVILVLFLNIAFAIVYVLV